MFNRDRIKKILTHPFVKNIYIAFIFAFVIDILNQRSLLIAFTRLFTHPLTTIFNVSIVLVPITLSGLFKRRLFALIMLCFPFGAIAIANFVLQFFRKIPLSFVDFFLVFSVFSIINTYLAPWQLILIAVGLTALIFGIVILYRKCKKKERYVKMSVISFLGTFAFSILFGLGLIGVGVVSSNYSNLTLGYRDYGLPYCFVMSVVDRGIDEPEKYNEQIVSDELAKMNVYLEDVQRSNASDVTITNDKNPNVIFLQLETFIDPTLILDLEFSQHPTPFFNSLKENNASGALIVPTFGAGTANTEFEILTGMSLDYFGAGEYPYTSVLMEKSCETLAYLLKDNGYYATAIHNNRATFYDRDTVFYNMGFDRYVPIEYMTDLEYTQVGWAKDNCLIWEIEKALTQTSVSDFVYAISVQPHGKYPTSLDEIENKTIEVTSKSGLDSDTIAEYTYLINQINEVDTMLKNLTEYLKNYPEPVIVVAYGDHYPNFPLEDEDVLLESIFKTEYAVWTNYEYNLEDKDLYTYQLGSHILETVGCDDGVLNLLHRTKDINEDYQQMLWTFEYDMFFGDYYVWGGKNPHRPGKLQFGYNDIVIEEVSFEEGVLVIKGQNFTDRSVVYINNKDKKTKYIDKNTLEVKVNSIKNNSSIKVSQVTDLDEVLTSTQAVQYIK